MSNADQTNSMSVKAHRPSCEMKRQRDDGIEEALKKQREANVIRYANRLSVGLSLFGNRDVPPRPEEPFCAR